MDKENSLERWANTKPKEGQFDKDNHYHLALALLQRLSDVELKDGMGQEFLGAILQHLNVTDKTLGNAIWHAYLEWDL